MHGKHFTELSPQHVFSYSLQSQGFSLSLLCLSLPLLSVGTENVCHYSGRAILFILKVFYYFACGRACTVYTNRSLRRVLVLSGGWEVNQTLL